MTINHIIISGGMHKFMSAYGLLKELNNKKVWNISEIKTLYATSSGSFLVVILCLLYDWDTIDDYIIKRPWEQFFKISPMQFFDIFKTKGLYNMQHTNKYLEDMIKPLLYGKNLKLNITLKELYEYSKIEIHLYSLEINEFKLHDLSYKTHPDLKVIDAIYMSGAYPIILAPFCRDGKCFIDGGLMLNCPIQRCVEQTNAPLANILSIKYEYIKPTPITDDTTMILYLNTLIYKIIDKINIQIEDIPNTIYCTTCNISKEQTECREDLLTGMINSITSEDGRRKLVESGITDARKFAETFFIEEPSQ